MSTTAAAAAAQTTFLPRPTTTVMTIAFTHAPRTQLGHAGFLARCKRISVQHCAHTPSHSPVAQLRPMLRLDSTLLCFCFHIKHAGAPRRRGASLVAFPNVSKPQRERASCRRVCCVLSCIIYAYARTQYNAQTHPSPRVHRTCDVRASLALCYNCGVVLRTSAGESLA